MQCFSSTPGLCPWFSFFDTPTFVSFLSSFVIFHCVKNFREKKERQKENKHFLSCTLVKGIGACLVEQRQHLEHMGHSFSPGKQRKFAICSFVSQPSAQKPDVMLHHIPALRQSYGWFSSWLEGVFLQKKPYASATLPSPSEGLPSSRYKKAQRFPDQRWIQREPRKCLFSMDTILFLDTTVPFYSHTFTCDCIWRELVFGNY